MRKSFTKLAAITAFILLQFNGNAQKRLYISNDDHTDYMWSLNEVDYDSAFVHMLDSWIARNQATRANAVGRQSRFNLDGTFWVWRYKKLRTETQFDTLIAQIQRGEIDVPYTPLVVTYGAVPTEAVLRTMYYGGELERKYGVNLSIATAMENQTMPLGLASLWKGSGAKYSWQGVCNCFTDVPGLKSREKEMYWYSGLDTNKILMKWYNADTVNDAGGLGNSRLGGYAEARDPYRSIDSLTAKIDNPTSSFNYNVASAFGVGHDDPQTLASADQSITAATSQTNGTRTIKVSNEVDFFQDFEATYGSGLETFRRTYGNDWELACAGLAEVSGKMKRSVEKLRSAEAMAAIVINYYPTIFNTVALDSLKRAAWQALGLYWEHSLGFGYISTVPEVERVSFQKRLEITFSTYVDQVYNLALSNMSNLITKDNNSNGPRFFAFNPLGWQRTDYADYPYPADLIPLPIRVFDVSSNTEVPSQFVTKNGVRHLRIEASNIPSVGYKVFEIQAGAVSPSFPNTGTLSANTINTDSFTVVYTNAGVITSVIDKRNGNAQLVQSGKYFNDLGTGNNSPVGSNSMIESNGPVSVVVLTTTPVSGTVPAHNTRITLFKKTGRIEIDNQITQNFSNNLTWAYAFNVAGPEIWHEEIGAVIKAKLNSNGGHYANQNANYEWATLNHFASVNPNGGGYGVSLSNQDCFFMKIGNSTFNFLDQNSAEIKVLAGGTTPYLSLPGQGGSTVFNQRFAITTHTSYAAVTEMKKSLEHQDPMVCGDVYNPVNFLLPNTFSFINNNDPGSIIWAVKPAEEGIDRGIVSRVWNLSDADAAPVLSYSLKMSLAKRITHVETDMAVSPGTITNNEHNLNIAVGHNEMRSYRVKLDVIALAAKAVTLTGEKEQGTNLLKWSISDESNYKTYELERSINGQQFTKIASIVARSGGINSYDYNDKNINNATPYYYRLRILNTDNNSFSYTNTVVIKAADDSYNVVLFPNPVSGMLYANFILDKKIRGTVAIYNTEGKMVKTVAPPLFERGNNYYSLSVQELPAGEYIFSVTAGEKTFVKNFIKN